MNTIAERSTPAPIVFLKIRAIAEAEAGRRIPTSRIWISNPQGSGKRHSFVVEYSIPGVPGSISCEQLIWLDATETDEVLSFIGSASQRDSRSLFI